MNGEQHQDADGEHASSGHTDAIPTRGEPTRALEVRGAREITTELRVQRADGAGPIQQPYPPTGHGQVEQPPYPSTGYGPPPQQPPYPSHGYGPPQQPPPSQGLTPYAPPPVHGQPPFAHGPYPSPVTVGGRPPVSGALVAVAWVVAILSCLYMLPWAIAVSRNSSSMTAVGLVNLFLGWSLIGWVVALVMACTGGEQQVVVINQHHYR